MEHHGSVTGWLHELQNGEEGEVQQRLWDRYFEQLVLVARARLTADVRRVEDEEDAVLSAFDSFFARVGNGQFSRLNDRTSLWPLLVTITVCKTRSLSRRQRALRRDSRRTTSGSSNDEGENWLEQAFREEPSPQLAVEAAEQAERLLDALGKATLQEVARLKLAGYSNAEIAERTGVMERSVERRLALIRKTWTEVLDAEESLEEA